MREFRKVAVGGTFDELHRGHKVLLTRAFEIGERVLIGLTSDELVQKMNKPHITATYAERLKWLDEFLDNRGLKSRAEVVVLDDPYGSSIRDPDIQALIVSEETKPTAIKINERRQQAHLLPLEIVVVHMVPSQNCSPISTTRIRRGEMDREGRLLAASSKT